MSRTLKTLNPFQGDGNIFKKEIQIVLLCAGDELHENTTRNKEIENKKHSFNIFIFYSVCYEHFSKIDCFYEFSSIRNS